MTPPPDDDLDWLYGRDRKPAAEPEHTQVIPTTPSPPSSRRVGAPSGSPVWDATAVHPVAPPAPASDPSRPDYRSDQPIYRDQPPPRVQPVSPPPPLGPGGPGQGSGGSGRPPKKRHPARNTFRVLGVLVLVFIVGLVAIPVYAWSQVNRVDEAPSGDRPDKQPGTTYLLVGSDSREGLTKEERKKLGTGSTGGQRTDTIMIMYVPPGGKPALISIPRDSFRPIPGHGSNKINAAFSFGGAPLLVETVEQSTGLRIDNYVEIGFGGFVNIIEAVGGIEMCLPKAIKDKNSHLNLPKGCQTLDGTTALGYVRMR
ncbi:MAG: LCP family protein, partial [Propionibacteriaceae bacterium]